MFSVADVCGVAVRIEENGERFYRRAISQIGEASCKDLLRWIADEEARHRAYFLEMKEVLPAKGEEWAELMGGAMLKDAVSDHAFSLDETPVDSLADEQTILETALGLEEDSILFYELLLSFIPDKETGRQVQTIVDEERRHVERLQERQASLGAANAKNRRG